MNCTARLNENEMDERLLLSPSYLGNNLGCNEDKGQVASCIDVADRIPLQLIGELSRKLKGVLSCRLLLLLQCAKV